MDANAGQKDETLRKIIDMCEEKYRYYRQILDDLVDEVLDSEEEGDDFCVPSEERRIIFLRGKRELAEQLRVTYRLPRNINQVLTPSKKGDKLVPLFDVSGKCPSYRCRGASEMLYAMIEADGRRTRWKSIARDIAS